MYKGRVRPLVRKGVVMQRDMINNGIKYDDLTAEQASNTRHQQKTLLSYRRLPNPCSPEDIDREYGYNGNKNSINSRLKRLQDDGLLQRIRNGEDKRKYRKPA